MHVSLSHLKALKVFEAAARLASFTRAADELCVTQAAVSHQIKGLEQKLGFTLFHRQIRKVALTTAGENLFRVVTGAFQDIETTIHDLRAHAAQSASLNISLTPSLSSKWLLPRLASFTAEFPNIELHLYHSISSRDLIKTEIDLSIRWGDGKWSGFCVERLCQSHLIPVCAPDYLRDEQPLTKPDDLRHYTLLHEDNHAEWGQWLRAAGARRVNSNRGLIIDDSNTLLLAAMNRQGIALGRTPLIYEDIKAGRLICPFDVSIPCEQSYYVLHAPAKDDQPAIRSFRAFLAKQVMDEAGMTPASRPLPSRGGRSARPHVLPQKSSESAA